MYKVYEIKKGIFDANEKDADKLREELKKEKVFLLNLMSSPGSGKTSTLRQVIGKLKDKLDIAVMEADIDGSCDAETIAKTGVKKVIQLHTGGMCHLDADMTKQGLEELGYEGMDLVILENVGNLVCPAEFDTGSSMNAMILSVPEGDDKPLKYPLMFEVADIVIINKMDVIDYFDFDLEKAKQRAKDRNPNVKIFEISAKTGQGIQELADFLEKEVIKWKS